MEQDDQTVSMRRGQFASTADRFWSKVDVRGPDDCWLWRARLDRHGYGQFEALGRKLIAHRVAFELAGGSNVSGVIMHSCDTRACCNPRHLLAGTQLDNMRDCVSKGRQAKGSGNASAKLTETDVAMMRDEYLRGRSRSELARAFGVTRRNVDLIVTGKTWAHVSMANQHGENR